ncbi:MAG TPA: FeoA family protein, partial [Anaerolineales bacterium]
EAAVAGWVPLTAVLPGQKVIVRRIHELAEHNSELMAFLEQNGVLTGVEATIVDVLPFNQTVTLQVQSRTVTLGFATAKYLYVER